MACKMNGGGKKMKFGNNKIYDSAMKTNENRNYNLMEDSEVEDDETSVDGTNYKYSYDSEDEEYEAPATTKFQGKSKKFRNNSIASSIEENSSSKQIKRLPTRRPNPKIYNRNALMARENRKKKKEYLQLLEQDVHYTKIQNRQLQKQMKHRDQILQKLNNEVLYLRSIIANKTSIMGLLKTIQGSNMPITSSALSFVTNETAKTDSPGSCSSVAGSMSPSNADEAENDLGFSHSEDHLPLVNNWENLLGDYNATKSYLPTLDSLDDADLLSNVVCNEHNYFNNNSHIEKNKELGHDDDSIMAGEPGICLHLSQGRVSLEFCASCHQGAQNAWIEEM